MGKYFNAKKEKRELQNLIRNLKFKIEHEKNKKDKA
jgi:hypothetical protein